MIFLFYNLKKGGIILKHVSDMSIKEIEAKVMEQKNYSKENHKKELKERISDNIKECIADNNIIKWLGKEERSINMLENDWIFSDDEIIEISNILKDKGGSVIKYKKDIYLCIERKPYDYEKIIKKYISNAQFRIYSGIALFIYIVIIFAALFTVFSGVSGMENSIDNIQQFVEVCTLIFAGIIFLNEIKILILKKKGFECKDNIYFLKKY